MKKRIYFLLWVAAVSLVFTSFLFWHFESGHNESIDGFFDVFWWWVVTSTTLGYGDIVPATTPGRIVSVFTIITGFFIYTNSVTIIAQSVHDFLERKNKGLMQVRVKNHIVICEYTAIADELIQAIPESSHLSGKDVVIVTGLVSSNPYPQHYFVNGVPINPAALRQSNIEEADYVFIFANLRFADPDVKSMHIASRVVGMNPRARIFVEMVDPDNELLKYAPDQLVPLDSRSLIKSVLKDKRVVPDDWFPE